MAITAALVFVGHNRLRYRVTQDGTAGTTATITTTGGATPDLRTDSVAGPIKNLALVVPNGYGPTFPAGAQTQAKARALWLSDTAAAAGASTTLPYAQVQTIQRSTPQATGWSVDANVASGEPTITIVGPSTAAVIYLDIFIPGLIGA